MRSTFDYIIVGAGSAGCVLANRLSENPDCNVLLIEAGGEPDPRLSEIPGAASWMQGTRSDWAFTTTPQRELFDRRIPYPRGRVLGGTSILNYLVYIRGNANDYDEWEQIGNKGWSYEKLLPYFKKAESNANIDDDYHGQDGPLSVEFNQNRHPLCDLFIEAAVSEGVTFNPDFNGASQDGCGYYQATIRNGRRCSAYRAYLDSIRNRANLFISKNSLAIRVVIENNRATGVEYLAEGRELKVAYAESEITLAAGAIGSPHLMMLSGLGPANHLISKNITVQADLPGVGQNLVDHLGAASVSAKIKSPDAIYGKVASSFNEALDEFEQTGEGVLATHYLDAGAFFSVGLGETQRSWQSFLIPGIAEFYRTNGVPDRSRLYMGGYPCRPKSQGSVRSCLANQFSLKSNSFFG